MTAPKPWYFKDGSPINAEQIRKIVERARFVVNRRVVSQQVNGNDYVPPEDGVDSVSHKLIVSTARHFAEKIEKHLVKILFAEFATLSRRQIVSSGDNKLDATRQWRRSYMRAYRRRVQAYDERRG